MPSASKIVKELNCAKCGKPLVKDGRVKCPRCKQQIELPASLPEGKWRCPECLAHGFQSRRVLAVNGKIKCRWCGRDQNNLTSEEKEMVQENEESILSCGEAQLILGAMSLNKKLTESNLESQEMVAVRHYVSCEDACKRKGLRDILPRYISCQEALEIWATKPGPLYLYVDVGTLREALAVEHVWGRTVKEQSSSYPFQHFGSCNNAPCRRMRDYWLGAPLCSHYEVEKETAEQIPFLIKVFLDERWPLEKLLEIQRQRLNVLLNILISGNTHPDYYRKEDVAYEIKKNLQSLQELISLGSVIPLED